jgi:hypothetical protein
VELGLVGTAFIFGILLWRTYSVPNDSQELLRLLPDESGETGIRVELQITTPNISQFV